MLVMLVEPSRSNPPIVIARLVRATREHPSITVIMDRRHRAGDDGYFLAQRLPGHF
jgi:hypothetical protein